MGNELFGHAVVVFVHFFQQIQLMSEATFALTRKDSNLYLQMNFGFGYKCQLISMNILQII